jgi:hypothetical protein
MRQNAENMSRAGQLLLQTGQQLFEWKKFAL